MGHDAWVRLVDRQPGAVLFRTASRTITAGMFLADARRVARALPEGRHVVNCCASRYWVAVGFAAVLLRGQVNLMAGDQSALGLGKLAQRFGGLVALTDSPGTAMGLPEIDIGAHAPAGDLVGDAGPVPLINATRIAAIVFTSGSTGDPEGTAKSFGELAARSRSAATRFGFNGATPTTIIGTVPPHHMYGLETTVLLPLHAEAASWCDPVFYPADLQHALSAQTGRSVLVTSPLQLRAMLEMPCAAGFPDLVISATAPLEQKLAAQAEAAWGTQVMEIFGATELGSVASRRTVTDPSWLVYPGLSLASGPGPDDGPLLSAEGAPTRQMTDVVALQDGGTRFHLLGRRTDMIKLGGRRASLAGLSRILKDIDGVSDGIFVAPEDLESRPTARLMALMVSDHLTPSDVLAALRTRIDPVFVPRPLVQVAALPRNMLGKLPREALMALLARNSAAVPPDTKHPC